MASFTLSASAARKVIDYSSETSRELMANVKLMDDAVNSQFSTVTDPSIREYMHMTEQMQDKLKQISGKLDAVSEYCDKVIRWIQQYSET